MRFRSFRKETRDIWESFHLVGFYMGDVHARVRDGKIAPLACPLLLQGAGSKRYSISDTLGAISHLRDKANPRRAVIDAICAFENFLTDLVELVYRDYPGKLSSSGGGQQPEQDLKLLEVILTSVDKDEMLAKLTEERIRTLFYGKPCEFFTKDKAKLEFGDHFSTKLRLELEAYGELTARRNLLVHAGGRVDRKYLREVQGSPFKLGQTVSLEPEYVRRGIALLEGLAATAACLVLKKIYKVTPRGTLAFRSFGIRATGSDGG